MEYRRCMGCGVLIPVEMTVCGDVCWETLRPGALNGAEYARLVFVVWSRVQGQRTYREEVVNELVIASS